MPKLLSNLNPPTSSSADAANEIVRISQRKKDFPIRLDFLQRVVDGKKIPGPARKLVTAGDHRGLLLYLLLLTKASSEPWDAALPAAAWARALGLALPDTKAARSTVSKVWLRLEQHGLVKRQRKERLADVFLLHEDGEREQYQAPGAVGDRYFRVPLDLWTSGPDSDQRWYQALGMPELVVMLIGRSLGDSFRLPAENGPDWYGISADTISRGLAGLQKHGLTTVDKTYKKAPLSAVGYTAEHHYTLQAPFGPVGRRSGTPVRPAPAKVAAPPKPVSRQPAPLKAAVPPKPGSPRSVR
jgi:hypothetical protein